MNDNKPIFAIVGPTASGKTEIGVELAQWLGNGEIINCDSVQIYKEIKIATAKPTVLEMKGVPHHLIDYVSPEIHYTASEWARDASTKIAEIESRQNTPILVGGTGFYLRALREPFFEGPETNLRLRDLLTETKDRRGPVYLHELLTKLDPETGQKLFPNDYVRTMRAIEVFLQTGERMSNLQPKRIDPPEFANRITIFALNPPRKALYERINYRAEEHFRAGLVEEVKLLRERGFKDTSNALGAHGYRRVCEYLRGERTLESAIEKTKTDVRNYAKRQMSWFRRKEDVIWLEGFGFDPDIQNRLLEIVRRSR